jgi:hypothetical protein
MRTASAIWALFFHRAAAQGRAQLGGINRGGWARRQGGKTAKVAAAVKEEPPSYNNGGFWKFPIVRMT